MRKLSFWCCGSLLLVVGAAQASSPAGLDKIAVYAGTWHSRTEHYATPYSKAGTETTTLHNDCWRARAFYACEQIVDGKTVALVVFQYDAAKGSYVTHPIPADGSAAGNGSLLIDGETWTFPWQFADHGKTVYARVVNVFHGRDRIDYRQEYSLDRQHWIAMARGVETRQP